MYTVEIVEASRELTAKERIQIKDTTSATKLDKATQIEPVEIDVAGYAVLLVHNDKSQDKDYNNYVVVDKSGDRYVTGSESFWSSFMNIYSELKDESDWILKVYRQPSKNREGKDFITCTVL